MPHVFVVAPNGSGLVRNRRQIRCCQPEGLNRRLLIHAHGVDEFGPCVMNVPFAVERDVSADRQDFLLFAVELPISFLQVAADPVGLDLVLVEDLP